MLPVGGLPGCLGGRELGGALDKLNFHMDMWGLTCFLWVVPQKFSFTGFWAPHKETSRPTEKQIHSTRRTTPAVGPRCHPLTLKTLIWKPFACCLYWLRFRSLCWEPSVVCHLFSLHFLPHIVVGFFFVVFFLRLAFIFLATVFYLFLGTGKAAVRFNDNWCGLYLQLGHAEAIHLSSFPVRKIDKRWSCF